MTKKKKVRQFELDVTRMDEEYEILMGSLGWRTDTKGAIAANRFWLGKLIELQEKHEKERASLLAQIGSCSSMTEMVKVIKELEKEVKT